MPSRQLDDVGLVVDGLERGVTGLSLDQAGDVQVDHLLTELVRNAVDELLAVEDPLQVLVVEDVGHAGQPQRRTGDDDRLESRWRFGFGVSVTVDLQPAFEGVREDATELDVLVVAHGLRRRRGVGHRPRGGVHRRDDDRTRRRGGHTVDGRRGAGRGVISKTGCPEPTHRGVERRQVAVLGVVGEQREDVVLAAEDVLDEAVQRLPRTHLDEHPRTSVVERV
jgi:hypothetical protein